MKDIRVAVVGCGVLGTRHAQIYSQIPHVKVVAVVDHHMVHAEKLGRALNVKPYDRLESLKGLVDAASICTPAVSHFEVSRPLLANNIHLLIEKPITTNLSEADALLKQANAKNLVLQTGHVERFNAIVPVISEAIKGPSFIECHRIGPYDPRISDVGVVLDLMIHDIDIVLHIVTSRVEKIDAIGMKIISPAEDFANARIVFENGTVASLTASRIARDRMRKIRIFQDNSYISFDYMHQTADILTKQNGKTNYRTIDIEKSEPLQDEIIDFIKCVRGQSTPTVTGEDGRNALEIALRILKQIERPVASVSK